MNSKDKDNYEKNFFENSESLKKFVLIIYISSLINLYLCIEGRPGIRKTTSVKAILEIKAKTLNQLISFYTYQYHPLSKQIDFFGANIINY